MVQRRGLVAAVLLVVLVAPALAGTRDEQPTDSSGRPVLDASGRRLEYGPEHCGPAPLRPEEIPPRRRVPAPQGSPDLNPQLLRLDAAIGTFSWDLGVSGITARDVDGDGLEEIFVGHTRMFYSVRYEPEAGGYTQRLYQDTGADSWLDPETIEAIRVGPVGGGADKLVVLSAEQLATYDAGSGALLFAFGHGLSSFYGMALAVGDVDSAAGAEILVAADPAVTVYRFAQASPLWSMAVNGPEALAVGQMDADGGLEIAVATGSGNPSPVFDAATRTVQWNYASGFGDMIDAGDIDGDGRAEVVSAEAWGDLMAFDVDTQQLRWSIPNFNTSAVRATDVTGDGVAEAIFGDAQFGDLHWYDGGGTMLGSVANPEHSVSAIDVADVDGDCRLDLIWGAGYSSSGSDRLYVADVASATIEWENIEANGAMSFAVGDVDADGLTEIVRVSSESDSGYDGSLLFVTDLHHRRDEYVPTAPFNDSWNGTRAVALAQLDGDPALEYLVNAGSTYDDRLAAFDGITHQEQWTTALLSSTAIMAIAVGDPDGNGAVDVVLGTDDGDVRVLRGADGALLWQSPSASGTSVMDIRVQDIDRDGGREIVVGRDGEGITVYDGATHAQEWLKSWPDLGCLEVGDYDSDGDVDVLAGEQRSGRVEVWDGLTKSLIASPLFGVDDVWALKVANVDGDSRNEMLVGYAVSWEMSRLIVWDPIAGAQLWSSQEVPGALGAGSNLFVGDADNDGQNEIVAAAQNSVLVWEYDAYGNDGTPPAWPGPVGIQSVTAVGPGCCPVLDLSWELANDTACPPVTYLVYRGTSPTFQPSASNLVARTSFRSHRDTGVSIGTQHYYIVRAVDACGNQDGNLVRLGAYPGSITIGPPALPAGAVGVPYNQTIVGSGGTAPYSFSLAGGALPIGLTMSASGLISGTPSVPASFGFTVRAADAVGCSGTKDYAITIGGAAGPAGNLVLGEGFGPPNENRIRVYRQDGTPTAVDFLAYGANAWGVASSVGFIGAAGTEDHVVAGPGPGAVFGPQVRAFLRDATPIGKVNFYAYGTLRYGVNAATAALDADAPREILSAAGPGAVFGPHVRGWNFDGGTVAPIAKVNFFAYGTLKYGVNASAGDVDADSFGELLTGPGPGTPFGPQVRGFNYDGSALASMGKINFNAFPVTQYGVNVAGGDPEPDAYDEIACAQGPGPAFAPRLDGFDFDGSAIAALAGFDVTLPTGTLFGARVGLAEITGDSIAELLAGAGRDPGASAAVRPYLYRGAALTPLLWFDPFPGRTYGVNVSGGNLGY